MNRIIRLVAVCALLLPAAIAAQNKFEGYNILASVPSNQKGPTCTVRYVNPSTVITIVDLDRSTPLNIKPCDGSGTNIVQRNADRITMRASGTTYKWCFSGEDKRYRVTFDGDEYTGPVTYDWIADGGRDDGFYNVRDFGAVGDGRSDDTIAIRSAIAYIASQNGGVLRFPKGDYLVNAPIALPSGITIEGIGGPHSNAATSHVPRKNPSRITLNGTRRAIFQIGECVEKVTIRDIELVARSNDETTGVEAFGAYTSSQDFVFDRVVFNGFNRGISVYGLPQTNLSWQFDYVKVNNCRFVYNRDAGIYTNIRNSDWKVAGSLFINPPKQAGQNADSMRFERVGAILLQDTFGGGFANALGGTFLSILDSGLVTIIGSQTESMTNSFTYNAENHPQAGDYSYPVTMINSIFGDPIIFNARRTFVSVGNSYGPQTFKADERVRVYSTGDRFCWDGYTLACGTSGPITKFDRATVIFMTGQPNDGRVEGHPTFFGTPVQFGAPVQMPSLTMNTLPQGSPNGSMVYCSDCRRSTMPCQSGGSGSAAMVVNGQWSCL